MTNKTKELLQEVEQKLNDSERVYGERSYSLSFDGVYSKVRKIRKLGYKVRKTGNNHYTVYAK